ncbi:MULTISPECIES: hypothetical protein [unclassified Microbacterium]|uniref:hypothetical protein n=1 Tax=unclassified Microbacterium TaxID=2609290 RepID=UPI00214C9709|nr:MULTISPECIES: hypothetical protein [unclassified Microbacterium]MCR2785428.1 hypothetical protein [Microbacterium sp. zg.B96]WIM14545.1 hypothetical protein QNO11_08120 [Microbacterium sp. zg-B96]
MSEGSEEMNKKNVEPITPGQLKLGKGMEKRLGVPHAAWDAMNREEAKGRNKMLLLLSQAVRDRESQESMAQFSSLLDYPSEGL